MVWSDPNVQKLAANFVCSTDEVGHLQSSKDVESLHFQKIAEQGHYAGRTIPTATRQGIYAAAPSGAFLASINRLEADAVAQMLQQALAKWEKLSREERLLSSLPKNDRRNWKVPEGGLVLRVNSRDLPRENADPRWGKAWNQDYAWFTKDEAKGFLQKDVPRELVERICRLNFVDNIRGQTTAFPKNAVEKARVTAHCETQGDLVTIRFEGETRISQEGRWPVRGERDRANPEVQKRGFEGKLLGRATYDLKKETFTAFELVAVGNRWGATQYNVRSNDPGPAPMGVALTLAGDSRAERVPPAYIWAYGWK